MDRQATFLLALGMLIAAAAVVSVAGWILFVRDRRAGRTVATDQPDLEPETDPQPKLEPELSSSTDPRSSDA